MNLAVDSVRTVSDTKREFYALHTRPIDSVYRRVIEELLVEMHLLSVNHDFQYDAVYALGVVSAFDQFMAGYRSETDRTSLFHALCQATGRSADQYRQDAQGVMSIVDGITLDDLKTFFAAEEATTGSDQAFLGLMAELSERQRFKYSRLFGIGLWTLLLKVAPELAEQTDAREALLGSVANRLSAVSSKLQKDIDLYRSNLDKLKQAQEAIADAIAADRKKREQRQAEAAAKAEAEMTSGENLETSETSASETSATEATPSENSTNSTP